MPKILFFSASSGSTSSASGVPRMSATAIGVVESGLLTVGLAATTAPGAGVSVAGWVLAGAGGWRKENAGTWLAGVQLSMPSFQTRVSVGNLAVAKFAFNSDSLI